MLLANSDLISWHPAQLYYSVLPFLPSDTYLARQYPAPRSCISVLTGREKTWPTSLFTLPPGKVLAFAPDGHMFAVGHDNGIHIYNGLNGLLNSSVRTGSSMEYSPYLATFTEDGCVVVVVSSTGFHHRYQIEKFDLVTGKQNGQIYRTILHGKFRLKLSEYGSYVAFAEFTNNFDTRICIQKTDGSDNISIPIPFEAFSDLDLAGESAHLVAVATKLDITIWSIPLCGVQRTLYHEGANYVRISRDGSFLASRAIGEAQLWSTAQGTVLARVESRNIRLMGFSYTNRLYMAEPKGESPGVFDCKVYDASADLNNVTIKSFPLPSGRPLSILPAPDESRILCHTLNEIQVLSLMQFTDGDAPRYDVMDIGLSGDASLLALATKTDIKILDARIGQCLHVIQSRSKSSSGSRPVAFSPKGELIVFEGDGAIIVMDVRTEVPLPTTSSQQSAIIMDIEHFGISFDSSKLAASGSRYGLVSRKTIRSIYVWDLPSGTLLHSLVEHGFGSIEVFQWSWSDH